MGTPWHSPAWHRQLQCPPSPGLGSGMSAAGLTALQGGGLGKQGLPEHWEQLLVLGAVSWGPTGSGFSHCHSRGGDPQVLQD